MAIFASLDHRCQLFSTEKASLVLGTATVNLVHIALAILLTISIVELVFTLLMPWLLWQPWPTVTCLSADWSAALCDLLPSGRPATPGVASAMI
jgi:hypothetical protein